MILFSLRLFLIAAVAFGTPTLSTALSKPQPPAIKFGPEWTFFNSVTWRDYLNKLSPQEKMDYVQQLDSHFESVCAKIPKCQVERGRGGYILVLIFEDGFELKIGRDPGVIEVSASPLTLREWRKKARFVQTHLFNELKKLGYAPHETVGAGHVNFGLEYFKNDLKLLRNFIIDFYNHPGVGRALNSDPEIKRNAPYLDQMGDLRSQHIQKNYMNINLDDPTFPELVKAFMAITDKYVALGLRDTVLVDNPLPYNIFGIGPTTRAEHRALRPQASMEHYILVLEILQARIYHLRRHKKNLVLAPLKQSDDPISILKEWANYLQEMGLPVERYRPLLNSQLRDIPVSRYLSHSGLSCKASVGGG